jgi:hypothetical protein
MSWRFASYDRESRGRRVLVMLVEATQRRLERGQPIDWERMRRQITIAAPVFADYSCEELQQAMRAAIKAEQRKRD